MDQALNSQKTPHTSPLRASYGMSFVSILMKNDRVIKGFYCTLLIAIQSGMIHSYTTRIDYMYYRKKVVRIISHANWKARTEPLFKELEILPIKDINIYIIAPFMFRFNNGLLPEIFDNFFTTNDKIHSYDTRSKNIYIHQCWSLSLGVKELDDEECLFGIK